MLLLCAALAGGAFSAVAAESISIRHAWARATVAAQPVGAAYLEITSERGATLVDLHSDAADFVEMHTMSHEGDVMRMRRVERLPLPAGQAVQLAPGGTHLMLIGLKRPLRAGESVSLVLTLEDSAGRIRMEHVTVPVRASAPAEAHR